MFAYLDDSVRHHLRTRITPQNRFQHKLSINVSKCQRKRSEVTFLGYAGTEANPPQESVKAILKQKKPETKFELRRFLGVVNYYKRCLAHAAETQALLNNYLQDSRKKDKRKIECGLQKQKEPSKNVSRAQPIAAFLAHSSLSATLILTTDVTDIVIGTALEQKERDHKTRPLAFFFKKLNPTETRYSAYDHELLAVYEVIILKIF